MSAHPMDQVHAVWPTYHLGILNRLFAFDKIVQEWHFLYPSHIRQHFYRTVHMRPRKPALMV
jgi:hypothetical protein